MSSITAFAGSVPALYDACLGPLLFEPYALDVVERLQSDVVQDVLELACGTGRVTRHLAAMMPPDGRLVATDLNAGMIELGRTLVRDHRVEWQVADAEHLPFGDNSFDHVICQFGVMFFSDKEQSYREAFRVVSKGGKYLFNVWDDLSVNPRSALIRQVLLEMMGEEAPDFLQKGPYSYFDREEICNEVLKAGFEHVNLDVVSKTTEMKEPANLITGFVDGSPLSAFLSRQTPAFRQEVKQRLERALDEQAGLYGNTVPMQALVVEAIK